MNGKSLLSYILGSDHWYKHTEVLLGTHTKTQKWPTILTDYSHFSWN